MTKSIEIDRRKRLRDEPHKGHNRWHPDIPPVIEVEAGEEVVLETRDANDLQIGPQTTAKDLERLERSTAHPLTGPVYVKGAEPGDLLEVEYLDIVPERYGWTRFAPSMGFMPDLFDHHFVVHWDIGPDFATSKDLPGVRIPNGAFMGTAGVAPSREQLKKWFLREEELRKRGGRVFPPDPAFAVPTGGRIAEEGLRTIPPRENCGNADVKQLTKGSKLFIPVAVDGALYSVGDGHYAQGDSECCGTAIEMGATAVVRFRVLKGEAKAKNIVWPRFAHPGMFAKPEHGLPRNFIATMGMPITPEGRNESCDITLATRNAVLEMIKLLGERGWSREQAYVLCSVAVDLRISNVVDVPNVTVSALLPEDIFAA
ncbi:MAG TPA: acetamidase/formamidase family protein [Burkholderiales bacterium]|nr:acetamidase/formamidase family protein [Burkholderiales bacterium]